MTSSYEKAYSLKLKLLFMQKKKNEESISYALRERGDQVKLVWQASYVDDFFDTHKMFQFSEVM